MTIEKFWRILHIMNFPPYFDMEFFLQISGESHLSGAELDACIAYSNEWSAFLNLGTVIADGISYCVAWLGEDIAITIDAAWEASPSQGYRLNALAQTLLMCAVHQQVPEIEEVGCAPVPEATGSLIAALVQVGLPARKGNGLELGNRFAVVTRAPFGGGCEICALLSSCPRAGRGASLKSARFSEE